MISIEHLYKSFPQKKGEKVVFHDLSLKVIPGEVYCLPGANGSGKTITLQTIATEGTIEDILSSSGEKERGTFSLWLVNQISRSSIAPGKTFYVIISSILNSFSSVLWMGRLYNSERVLKPL